MLVGQYDYAIDAKGRLNFPARFRDAMGETFIVTRWLDHCLAPGGRLCVITFHSLEDRLVKNKFRRWAQRCTCPPEQPICTCGGVAKAKLITRKPIEADAAELETNRRSRSAKLRVLEKV